MAEKGKKNFTALVLVLLTAVAAILASYAMGIEFIFTFPVITSLGLIIQSFIKGTFWRSNLTCGMGGAFIGIALTGSFFYCMQALATSKGELVLALFFMAATAIPIAAIVGALLFIIIGMVIRIKAKRDGSYGPHH